MSRRAIVLVLVLAACGGGTADTTVAPATTTSTSTSATTTATTTTAAGTGTWFDGLAAGVCFQDAFADNQFDFSVPAATVDCDQPHDNEIVALASLGDAFPADVAAAANAACDPEYEAFLGRPITTTLMFPFTVHPERSDWDAGVRHALCIVYAGQPVVGTAASAGLTAPGEMLAVYREVEGDPDLWLVDAGTGEVLRNVSDNGLTELLGPPAWSPDGTTILYAALVHDDNADIFAVSPDGAQTFVLVDGPFTEDNPAVSPTELVLAYIDHPSASEDFDIYLLDLETLEKTRLTTQPGRDSSPVWSPDGSRILYRSRVGDTSDIWVMDADGSNAQRLTDNGADNFDPRWSPDGETLLFTTDLDGNFDIWAMDVDGGNQRPLTTHPADDEYPTFSSDGRYIAFHSSRHGGTSLWLMRADGSDQSELTGYAPMGYPRFSPVGG